MGPFYDLCPGALRAPYTSIDVSGLREVLPGDHPCRGGVLDRHNRNDALHGDLSLPRVEEAPFRKARALDTRDRGRCDIDLGIGNSVPGLIAMT